MEPYGEKTEAKIAEFEQALKMTFNDKVQKIIGFKDGSTDDIQSIDSEWVIEISNDKRTLHAHVLTTIKHNCLLLINRHALVEKVMKALHLKEKIYLNIQVLKTRHDVEEWKQYMLKNVDSQKKRPRNESDDKKFKRGKYNEHEEEFDFSEEASISSEDSEDE